MKALEPLDHPLDGLNLIEASAGTGKTYTITTLFLRLLLERRLGVRDILVVTYTNAATAELRARLRSRLAAAIDVFGSAEPTRSADETLARLAQRRVDSLEDDRRRLTAALYAFDEAAVFTIHGFCQRILQEHAFESGVLFDAQLVTDQRPLVREIVRDFWVSRLHDADREFVRFLKSNKKGLDDLTGLALRGVALSDVPLLPKLKSLPPGNADHATRLLRLRLELVEHARHELARRKEEANIQYFDDLLTRLRDGLSRPAGSLLAESIRRRYPAALIDEFQDTDPIQYRIFHQVYGNGEAPLFLIGDPKQAIYSFRGADVFTYVEAKRHVTAGHEGTLLVNHRSDPRLLRAVNALFGSARLPFVLDGIPFRDAAPAESAAEHLGGSLAGTPPLQILYVGKGEGKALDKKDARPRIRNAIAAEISRLLQSGATVKGAPVRPNHIAVLCRTNDEARRLQTELRELRVPSVLQTDESVLETDEAQETARLLDALADPSNTTALVGALATSLIGVGAAEIRALREEASGWDLWTERFHRWRTLWLEAGFMPAFRALLEECGVPERVLSGTSGERRMTNLLHLAEILHTAAAEGRRGPLALAEWYAEVRNDPDARADAIGDAAQIRLESDDLALVLATVHRSKGLEYPIVYCPFLWDGVLLRARDKSELRFHDEDNDSRLTLDIATPPDPAHKAIAERESLAENLRLLYVALTRARHRCTVIWGALKDNETSALGYVLHQDPAAPTAELIGSTRTRIKTLSDAQMVADLRRLADASGGSIEIAEMPEIPASIYQPATEGDGALRCADFARALRLAWRTASFSSLIAGSERISHEAEEGIDRDEGDEGEARSRAAAAEASVVLADFPAGTRAGQLLHSVLENLDFQGDDAAIDASVVARLAEYGFEPSLRESLARAVAEVLRAPLASGADAVRLERIPARARLNELEFLFPVPELAADGRGVHSGDLATAFARNPGEVSPAYVEGLRRLGFAPLSGFLKGYVDLVFVHENRWYVVDYKSNHLGPRPSDYEVPRLLAAMEQHHYFLQYHLYTVALHRYLGQRLRDYDYERHFGGVYYLFLRGMSPAHRPGNGVFAARPPRALIEDLSSLLGGVAA